MLNRRAINTSSSRRQKYGSTRRAGFSLLEIVLALSLAIVLLGGIYSAIDQSRRLTATGREEKARSQVARYLLQKMALDIRSVTFVPPPATEDDSSTSTSSSTATNSSTSTSTSSSSGSTSTSSTSGTASSTELAEPTAKSIGIRGTSTQIELHISRARRDLNLATNVEGKSLETRSSDLLVVKYGLQLSSPTESTSPGLTRLEGDRLSVQAAEEAGRGVMNSKLQVLAPEIVLLTFRYFDGSQWYETWDSESAGYLPRAVEIVIAYPPAKSQGGALLNVEVSSSTDRFRTVVAVPIADPLPPELIQ
ncbi:MAG: hypothetical protein FJ267_00010 [Planctomycetes bacterium]|nr:hypothetical protein [Planctomycetota bacterium]